MNYTDNINSSIMTGQLEERPSIYSYLDYRSYINDLYAHLKLVKRGFSLRTIRVSKNGSKRECYSAQFLHKVMSGEKPMPDAMVAGFSTAFGLNDREAQFLERLIRYTLAESPDEKRDAYSRLAWRAEFRDSHGVGSRQRLLFITHGYIGDIYLMTALPQFRADALLISEQLLYDVTQAEVEHALQVLQELNLVTVGDMGQVNRQGTDRPEPSDGEPVLFQLYHQEQCDKAKAALTHIGPEQRGFTTWGISRFTRDNFKSFNQELNERVQQVLAELVNKYESQSGDSGDVVAQVNLQVFPVNQTGTDKGGAS